MVKDPNEWTNLADNPEYADQKKRLARWLPKSSLKPAPGSRARVLIYENGKANWEGEDIGATDPIPEL